MSRLGGHRYDSTDPTSRRVPIGRQVTPPVVQVFKPKKKRHGVGGRADLLYDPVTGQKRKQP